MLFIWEFLISSNDREIRILCMKSELERSLQYQCPLANIVAKSK